MEVSGVIWKLVEPALGAVVSSGFFCMSPFSVSPKVTSVTTAEPEFLLDYKVTVDP